MPERARKRLQKGKLAAECNIQTKKLTRNLPMEKLVAKKDKKGKKLMQKPACCQEKLASECKYSEGKACAESADPKP